ncbi:MAG: hypothetical protein K1X67_17150 [Fimbriimonadaceae bacterium]|nr:hypothetical protein [Fimbriimonadaceae bacterium]
MLAIGTRLWFVSQGRLSWLDPASNETGVIDNILVSKQSSLVTNGSAISFINTSGNITLFDPVTREHKLLSDQAIDSSFRLIGLCAGGTHVAHIRLGRGSPARGLFPPGDTAADPACAIALSLPVTPHAIFEFNGNKYVIGDSEYPAQLVVSDVNTGEQLLIPNQRAFSAAAFPAMKQSTGD